jgi:hypothetical protein
MPTIRCPRVAGDNLAFIRRAIADHPKHLGEAGRSGRTDQGTRNSNDFIVTLRTRSRPDMVAQDGSRNNAPPSNYQEYQPRSGSAGFDAPASKF